MVAVLEPTSKKLLFWLQIVLYTGQAFQTFFEKKDVSTLTIIFNQTNKNIYKTSAYGRKAKDVKQIIVSYILYNMQVCLSIYDLLVDTRHWRVKTSTRGILRNFAKFTTVPESLYTVYEILYMKLWKYMNHTHEILIIFEVPTKMDHITLLPK